MPPSPCVNSPFHPLSRMNQMMPAQTKYIIKSKMCIFYCFKFIGKRLEKKELGFTQRHFNAGEFVTIFAEMTFPMLNSKIAIISFNTSIACGSEPGIMAATVNTLDSVLYMSTPLA